MAIFYDTHAHLDYPEFAAEVPEIISRASAAGIRRMISIGTDLESSRRAIALAEKFDPIYAAVGWHPSHATEAPHDLRPALRELAGHPKVVALGETGLDYYRLPSKKQGLTPADDDRYKARQRDLFRQHLEVGAELGLNCVIHTRESFDDAIADLERFAGRVRGVFHCFSEDVACLRRVLALNSLVSFTGILTFKNAQNMRDSLATAPLGTFMFETDSPYLAPVPYRGKRCEPAYVKEISEAASQIRQCPVEDLSRATCATAHEFFRGLK